MCERERRLSTSRSAELQLRQVRRAREMLIAPGWSPALQFCSSWSQCIPSAKGGFPCTCVGRNGRPWWATGQPLAVEAKKVQHRGVQIVHALDKESGKEKERKGVSLVRVYRTSEPFLHRETCRLLKPLPCD